jgi:hypothetical protein
MNVVKYFLTEKRRKQEYKKDLKELSDTIGVNKDLCMRPSVIFTDEDIMICYDIFIDYMDTEVDEKNCYYVYGDKSKYPSEFIENLKKVKVIFVE